MKARIQYSKERPDGTRKSKIYKSRKGAEYYIVLHKEECWAKVINAKRRNVIDKVSCTNYNVLRTAARRILFNLGVVFEKEFKPAKSKDGKKLSELATIARRAKESLEKSSANLPQLHVGQKRVWNKYPDLGVITVIELLNNVVIYQYRTGYKVSCWVDELEKESTALPPVLQEIYD